MYFSTNLIWFYFKFRKGYYCPLRKGMQASKLVREIQLPLPFLAMSKNESSQEYCMTLMRCLVKMESKGAVNFEGQGVQYLTSLINRYLFD